MSDLQNFIEHNGHIYKLNDSKEEIARRQKREEEQRQINIGRFKDELGVKLFDKLCNDGVIVRFGYDPEYIVDFRNKGVETAYEYGDHRSASLGDYSVKDNPDYKYTGYTSFFTRLLLALVQRGSE